MALSGKLRGMGRQMYDAVGRVYLSPALRREERPVEGTINEDAFSYAMALRALTTANARRVLDVGTGLAAWPRVLADCGFQVTAIDSYSKAGYWGTRPFNRHYPVHQDDITDPRVQGEFDAVTCLNVLMAISDDQAAISGMFTLIKPNGLAVLSFPYNASRSVANAYTLPGSGYGQDFLFPCRVYCADDVGQWLNSKAWTLEEQEVYELFSGELWTMGHRVPPKLVRETERHHFTTIVLRKRETAR